MNFRLSALTILIFSLPCLLAGQKNFSSARIVLNTNDTLQGFIDYKEWHTNPESVLFSKDKQGKGYFYHPGDISYFEITGREAYKRFRVSISMDPEAIGNLSEKDTTRKVDLVFLRVLKQGKNVSLFSYTDKLKRRYYILENNDTTPVELQNSVFLNDGQVVEEKQYRSVLKNIALKYKSTDDKIFDEINRAEYYQETMESICNQVNGVQELSPDSKPESKEARYRFFAGAGVNAGSLKFIGDNQFTGKTKSPFYYPLVDLGVDLFLKPSVGKLFLRAQVEVTAFKTTAYTFEQHFAYKDNYYFNFRQINVSVMPQLNYNFYNTSSFKWFVGAGGGFNFSFYPQNEQKFTREITSDTTIINNKYLNPLKKFWLNAVIRTGVVINRLETSFIFLPKSAITQLGNFELANSSLQLQFNYLFGNKKRKG
ncbi:MAG: hypothetical protein JST09_18750 [Bacteroidetes bacterium]|nr:hypothetical protein [Bacteroidota bacterium]